MVYIQKYMIEIKSAINLRNSMYDGLKKFKNSAGIMPNLDILYGDPRSTNLFEYSAHGWNGFVMIIDKMLSVNEAFTLFKKT